MLNWVELVETVFDVDLTGSYATFSTLNWVELVETPHSILPAAHRGALSVPSTGSNWLKHRNLDRPPDRPDRFQYPQLGRIG